jgi:hypothetical protein
MTAQRRPVLVLDRENPLSIVVERFDRLGISDSDTFKYFGGWCPDEAPAPWSPIVIKWVQDCEPKPLIVVDSLVAFLEGEENNATEVRKYMQGFRRLADMGATVIILHHSGKGETSKDYRGSSDIKASVDVAYNLTNKGGDPSRLATIQMRAFKARFSVKPEFNLRYFDGGFSCVTSQVARASTNDVLRDLLMKNPDVTTSGFYDLASGKASKGEVNSFLASGLGSGRIQMKKGRSNSKKWTWFGDDFKPEPDLLSPLVGVAA